MKTQYNVFQDSNAIWSYPIDKHVDVMEMWLHCQPRMSIYTIYTNTFLAYSMSTSCVGTQVRKQSGSFRFYTELHAILIDLHCWENGTSSRLLLPAGCKWETLQGS